MYTHTHVHTHILLILLRLVIHKGKIRTWDIGFDFIKKENNNTCDNTTLVSWCVEIHEKRKERGQKGKQRLMWGRDRQRRMKKRGRKEKGQRQRERQGHKRDRGSHIPSNKETVGHSVNCVISDTTTETLKLHPPLFFYKNHVQQ